MGPAVFIERCQYEALLQENKDLQRDNRYLRLLSACSHNVASSALNQIDLLRATIESLVNDQPSDLGTKDSRNLLPAIAITQPACTTSRNLDTYGKEQVAEAYDTVHSIERYSEANISISVTLHRGNQPKLRDFSLKNNHKNAPQSTTYTISKSPLPINLNNTPEIHPKRALSPDLHRDTPKIHGKNVLNPAPESLPNIPFENTPDYLAKMAAKPVLKSLPLNGTLKIPRKNVPSTAAENSQGMPPKKTVKPPLIRRKTGVENLLEGSRQPVALRWNKRWNERCLETQSGIIGLSSSLGTPISTPGKSEF